MKQNMKNDEIFVRHMLDAINELQTIFNGLSFRDLVNDPIRMHASVRLFEILGEAASKLSPNFRKSHADIPFSDIVGMRNKLRPHYFEVDLETLWKTYEEDLPSLKKSLESAIFE
jgi:uncharacterized protein with HEPN domain